MAVTRVRPPRATPPRAAGSRRGRPAAGQLFDCREREPMQPRADARELKLIGGVAHDGVTEQVSGF